MEPWPLRHLVLRTPRLELRPDDDEGLVELAEEAARGVHPPEQMPFMVPWTDAPPERLGINTLQYYWSVRADLRPEQWRINFLVRLDGKVIGTQGIGAKDFAVTREVDTGSWIGMRHQRHGYGTEARAAVLGLAFDHLAAVQARSTLFADNLGSLGVSHTLGYVEDGTRRDSRRGEAAIQLRMLVTADRFADFRPQWKLDVEGIDACLPLLI